jgi:hypothetical protein
LLPLQLAGWPHPAPGAQLLAAAAAARAERRVGGAACSGSVAPMRSACVGG